MNICPNCNSRTTTLVYKNENVITYQNVLMSSYNDALNTPRGKIELLYCNDCTFLYNALFDESKVGYGEDYENDQSHSSIFMRHIDGMASKITSSRDLNSHKILEIGCGNGYFLKKIINEDNKNVGVGYDKSLKADILEDRLQLYKKYYDKTDKGNYNVVLSRHVVEHILNNNTLMQLLKNNNPEALFIVETPSLEWIIENNTFFDIFYEHCSYFSKFSLSKLMANHNLSIDLLETVFNQQYLWVEAKEKSKADIKLKKTLCLEDINKFFHNFSQMISYYQSLIAAKIKDGKIAIWGAGAKGVTFANLIDPHNQLIDCVIDINPKKIGKFIPGSGHEIVSKSVLLYKKFSMVIIMNSNYLSEISSEIGRNIYVCAV